MPNLALIANTVRRMNSREKIMVTNGESVTVETARNGGNLTSRRDSIQSEEKIMERLQDHLSKRDIFTSNSVSRPMLKSSNIKHRPRDIIYNGSDHDSSSEFGYEDGEGKKSLT